MRERLQRERAEDEQRRAHESWLDAQRRRIQALRVDKALEREARNRALDPFLPDDAVPHVRPSGDLARGSWRCYGRQEDGTSSPTLQKSSRTGFVSLRVSSALGTTRPRASACASTASRGRTARRRPRRRCGACGWCTFAARVRAAGRGGAAAATTRISRRRRRRGRDADLSEATTPAPRRGSIGGDDPPNPSPRRATRTRERARSQVRALRRRRPGARRAGQVPRDAVGRLRRRRARGRKGCLRRGDRALRGLPRGGPFSISGGAPVARAARNSTAARRNIPSTTRRREAPRPRIFRRVVSKPPRSRGTTALFSTATTRPPRRSCETDDDDRRDADCVGWASIPPFGEESDDPLDAIELRAGAWTLPVVPGPWKADGPWPPPASRGFFSLKARFFHAAAPPAPRAVDPRRAEGDYVYWGEEARGATPSPPRPRRRAHAARHASSAARRGHTHANDDGGVFADETARNQTLGEAPSASSA